MRGCYTERQLEVNLGGAVKMTLKGTFPWHGVRGGITDKAFSFHHSSGSLPRIQLLFSIALPLPYTKC